MDNFRFIHILPKMPFMFKKTYEHKFPKCEQVIHRLNSMDVYNFIQD